MLHPALYRAGQFFVALKACLPAWAGGVRGQLSPADKALVTSVLPAPPQQQLFARMSPNDQRHAIAVAGTLRQAGHKQPALMQAALLHDVGKSLGQPLIHRVLIVLLEAFWPAALQRLSNESANGEFANGQMTNDKRQMTRSHSSLLTSHWRRPFIIHAQHPAIGAAWAEKAGCDPSAVTLILKHQDEIGDESSKEEKLLAALQWADNLN